AIISSSCRRDMRRWQPSWLGPTRSSPASSGVRIATSGPGATHLVTGIYDARADHQPLLAIVGQQARGAIGGHYCKRLISPPYSKMLKATSFSNIRHGRRY